MRKDILKKIISSLCLILVLGNFFTSFNFVHAQQTPGDTSYHLLAPLPCESKDGIGAGSGPGCEDKKLKSFDPTTTDGQKNRLGTYLNLVIKLILGLSAVLAMVMIVIGGVEYMTTELISGKEAGKERIRGAILGLLLALGAYALLNTINPDLLKNDIAIENAMVSIDINADVAQIPVNGKYANGATFGSAWNDTVGKALQPCAKVGDTGCLPAFVTVNASECTTVGQTNCTSTRGLNTSTLLKTQWGCKCNLTVTGGTESWLHGGQSGNTSHMKGSSTVDLKTTPELSQYIAGNQPLVPDKRYIKDGISYLYESHNGVTHWHAGP